MANLSYYLEMVFDEGEQAEKYVGKKVMQKYRSDKAESDRIARRSKREIDSDYNVTYGSGNKYNKNDPDKNRRRETRSADEARRRAVNRTMSDSKKQLEGKSKEDKFNAQDALNRRYRKDAKQGIYHYESAILNPDLI